MNIMVVAFVVFDCEAKFSCYRITVFPRCEGMNIGMP